MVPWKKWVIDGTVPETPSQPLFSKRLPSPNSAAIRPSMMPVLTMTVPSEVASVRSASDSKVVFSVPEFSRVPYSPCISTAAPAMPLAVTVAGVGHDAIGFAADADAAVAGCRDVGLVDDVVALDAVEERGIVGGEGQSRWC